MKQLSATVTSKGQLVIPAELRRKSGIKKGTKVCFLEDELGRIILQPVTEEFIDRLTGSLSGSNMLDGLLKDRQFEGEHDK
jgi:AbrB family looped-hinge helix DNA binding protein